MHARIIAANPEKGLYALRFPDRIWVVITVDPARVGDTLVGQITAAGSATLYNETARRKLDAFASNGNASLETLWRDLQFDSPERFAAVNPAAHVLGEG